MADDDLLKKLKSISLKEDINILLLGTTGVGKSTFINSFVNYLTYGSFGTVKEEELITFIPCTVRVTDKDHKPHTVKVGTPDSDESQEVGDSATQDVKRYTFAIPNCQYKVTLIDTPGIGDTRGIEQDNVNSENILSHISEMHNIHAICMLFKSNETRSTVFFEYCIAQIFSRLDKSATNNIAFIFTNTRGTDYGPGDTISILQKFMTNLSKRPPYVDVPINRNIFCFDNEPFKYLAAHKQKVQFDKSYEDKMEQSWVKSQEQCMKLINYITGDDEHPPLKPHFVKSTSAINEARRMITYLSRPLADISQVINQNLYVLERHRRNLTVDSQSLEEMRKKLYMPVVNVDVVQMTQPATVCTTRKCAEVYKVGDKNNWHYKQRCHDPCYLRDVQKEIIGTPELERCAAMSNRQCTKCGCYFSVHMHIYYFTKVKEERVVDQNVQDGITSREAARQEAQKLVDQMDRRQKELQNEHRFIVTCSARFAHFLQNNAITPCTDSYKAYIEYLVEREKALGSACDQSTLDDLRRLLDEYNEARRSFDMALELDRKLDKKVQGVMPNDIHESIQELYRLKHYGRKIREMFDSQKKARKNENKKTDVFHNISFKLKQEKTLANESQKSSYMGNDRNRQRGRNVSPPPPYDRYGHQNRGQRQEPHYNRARQQQAPSYGPRRDWGPQQQRPPPNFVPPFNPQTSQGPRPYYNMPPNGNPSQGPPPNWTPRFNPPAWQGPPPNWSPPANCGPPPNWFAQQGPPSNWNASPANQPDNRQGFNVKVSGDCEGFGRASEINITLDGQGGNANQQQRQEQPQASAATEEQQRQWMAWCWWWYQNVYGTQQGNNSQQSHQQQYQGQQYGPQHPGNRQWQGNNNNQGRARPAHGITKTYRTRNHGQRGGRSNCSDDED